MAWAKYDKDSLVNLDRITDINIKQDYTVMNRVVYSICFHCGRDNRYFTKPYYKSFEECMHAFEYLTGCLRSGKQFIDMTNIPAKFNFVMKN